jgi:DnaD/phage-associated family protein
MAEIKAFYDLVQAKQLSTGQIALWHALMHQNNKCAWIEWFTVPNITLELNSGLSRSGIYKARNILKQYGVIDFKSNGTRATSYKLISLLYSKQESNQLNDTLPNSNQDSKQDGKQDGKQDSNQDGKQVGNTLNKLDNTRLNETIVAEEGNKKIPAATALYDDGFKSIIKAFGENIHPPSPIEAERLESWLDDMDADVIIEAIQEAVLYNQRKLKYIEGILKNWHNNNIKTKLDLDAYKRDWQDKKQKEGQAPGGLNKTTDFGRFEQHDITEEQLEGLFEEIG